MVWKNPCAGRKTYAGAKGGKYCIVKGRKVYVGTKYRTSRGKVRTVKTY